MREEFAEQGGGEAFLKLLRTDPEDDGPRKWWMPMEIRYTLTPEDYAEGNRLLLLNSTFKRKLSFYVFVRLGRWFGIPMLVLAVVLFALNLALPTWSLGPGVAGVLAALAWFGVVGTICPYSYKRKIGRYFKEQKMGGDRAVTADGWGILLARTDGTSEGKYAWSALDGGAESNELFALFPNRLQFVPIPKRAMSAEQQADFRMLVSAHIPNSGDLR